MTRITILAPLAALLALSLGCGDGGPKIVKVKGKITRNGQPVPNCTVHFVPIKGRPSWGQSNEAGEFTLSYDLQREGAEVGQHRVYVEFRANSPEEEHRLATGRMKWPRARKEILEVYGNPAAPAIELEVTDTDNPIEVKLD